MSRPSMGPTQPTTLSLWLKRARSEVNTSPTSNAKIKNRWSYNLPPLSLLHITSWYAEEKLCFWGLIATVECISETWLIWAVIAAWRDVYQQILTKTVTLCPSSSFVPSPYRQCFDHWCHYFHVALSTSLQFISTGVFNYVNYAAWNDHVSSPVLFLDFFQHVYRIQVNCHLLQVTPSP